MRISIILGLALLLGSLFGCAPSLQNDGNLNSSDSTGIPELSEDLIRERINDAFVRKVPEENGAGEPINWSFDKNEPKEFVIVEKLIEDGRANIVLDIKTSSAPGARTPRRLAGQIRTKWELQTGWALRKWEIVDTENISLKYKNLPKPPEKNANH